MKLPLILITALITLFAFSQSLPDFDFQDAGGNKVDKSSLIEGQPVIVFYFDPFCDHCQWQANALNEHTEEFKDINLLWVSWAEHEDNEAFYEEYLSRLDNSIACKDHNYLFDNLFGYSEVPSIYCYNANWELVASFKEEQPAEILLKAVE